MSGYMAEAGYHTPFMQSVRCRKWLLFTKSLERYICVSISGLLMLLPSMTHSLYLVLRKPYKQLNWLCGLPRLIWPKVICNWLWMRLTSIKQHSVQACLVFMSSLVCLSGLSNVGASFCHASWRCVLGINSSSRSCSISTIFVSLAALSMRCWTGLSWY